MVDMGRTLHQKEKNKGWRAKLFGSTRTVCAITEGFNQWNDCMKYLAYDYILWALLAKIKLVDVNGLESKAKLIPGHFQPSPPHTERHQAVLEKMEEKKGKNSPTVKTITPKHT